MLRNLQFATHTVDGRCFHRAMPHETVIGPRVIVGDDEQDIGRRLRVRARTGDCAQTDKAGQYGGWSHGGVLPGKVMVPLVEIQAEFIARLG